MTWAGMRSQPTFIHLRNVIFKVNAMHGHTHKTHTSRIFQYFEDEEQF